MQYDPRDLPLEAKAFMGERHLSTLSLVTPTGGLHVTPVGFTWDDEAAIARVITFAASKKARLVGEHRELQAAVAQVDGGRWLSLHGTATVSAESALNADAERRYAARYRPPGDLGADRRTIELVIDRIVGRC